MTFHGNGRSVLQSDCGNCRIDQSAWQKINGNHHHFIDDNRSSGTNPIARAECCNRSCSSWRARQGIRCRRGRSEEAGRAIGEIGEPGRKGIQALIEKIRRIVRMRRTLFFASLPIPLGHNPFKMVVIIQHLAYLPHHGVQLLWPHSQNPDHG